MTCTEAYIAFLLAKAALDSVLSDMSEIANWNLRGSASVASYFTIPMNYKRTLFFETVSSIHFQERGTLTATLQSRC